MLTGQKSKIISDSFILTKPALWWPIPLGGRPLYEMTVSVFDAEGNLSDQVVEQFGVRTLKKIQNEDSHWLDGLKIHKEEFVDGEYNWTFVINDEKVFARGVNWIPVDAMLDLHPERYRYLLRLAAAAGVNMIRVWGEGLYETNAFYNLCDSLGIMVWQDFWIGSYSPAQSQDKSWEAVVTNIQRTRNHPSLVVYCGGNEFDASRADRVAQINKLKQLCEIHDGTRDFHKASPFGGSKHGGMGIVPKEQRRHQYWRFIAEGGYTQSWPPRSDMLKFMKEEHLFPIQGNEDRLAYRNSSIIGHPHANDAIYGVPQNLDELIHIEMLNNIIGWQSELENTRLEKYKVSGCLFWAHNDVWPTTSWSMVDYYGTGKNHYYAFKKAARPIQVVASQCNPILKPGEKYDLEICLINDYLQPQENLQVRAAIYLGEKGRPVYKKEMTGSVNSNSSVSIGNIDWTIPSDPEEHNFLLRLELYGADAYLIARNEYTCMIGDENRNSISGGFFGEYHNWSKISLTPKLKKFPVKMKIRDEKHFTVTYQNTTPNVVMGLETLITDLPDGVRFYLDDNYIHLLPGEKRTLNASLEISERIHICGPIRLTIQTDGWNVKRQVLQLKVDVIKQHR
jgi:beta-mannosidase